MKILRLQTQGFQRVTMVDVTPDSAVVEVRGDNAEGKSSLLDSIKAALGGADAAPIKPIRTGDDYSAIRVTLGDDGPDLIVTKYFDEIGEKLRVETADGAEFKGGQTKVNDLLGRMTFDPLAFAKAVSKDQVADLLRIAPLKIDLGQLAKDDEADKLARRDVNRDAKALKARLDVIPVETDLPAEKPDLEALTTTLASAADTNTAIERERDARASLQRVIEQMSDRAIRQREEAAYLIEQAEEAERAVATHREDLAARPKLDEPVNTDAARLAIDEARATLNRFARQETRDQLAAEFDALKIKSEAFTASMADRAKLRAEALAAAEMPVPGLSLARLCDVVPTEEAEDLVVVYEGEPFAQASGAQQLRVSMRPAMAANPKLRVMLIKDGSLLDSKGLALVKEMADEGRYQVWLESVGEGDGTGLIMEAGSVRGAPEPERLDGPKRRKAKAEGEPEPTDKLTAQGVHHGLPPEEANKLSDFIDKELAKEPAAPPARRKPSAMREFSTSKPGDLFGGDA